MLDVRSVAPLLHGYSFGVPGEHRQGLPLAKWCCWKGFSSLNSCFMARTWMQSLSMGSCLLMILSSWGKEWGLPSPLGFYSDLNLEETSDFLGSK